MTSPQIQPNGKHALHCNFTRGTTMLVTYHKFFSIAVVSHTRQLVGDVIPSSLWCLTVTSYTLVCVSAVLLAWTVLVAMTAQARFGGCPLNVWRCAEAKLTTSSCSRYERTNITSLRHINVHYLSVDDRSPVSIVWVLHRAASERRLQLLTMFRNDIHVRDRLIVTDRETKHRKICVILGHVQINCN